METKHKIYLRRIDYINSKLLLFLFFPKKIEKKIKVERDGFVFEIGLGVIEKLPQLYAYTDVEFEANLDIDLALFERENPLMVDTEHLKIESAEGLVLKKAKETEHIKIEEQLINLFPLVLDAFNTFRKACKVVLFKDSVAGRILARNIQDSQIHWGVNVDTFLEKYFSGSDTELLFGAFANLNLSSFTGDADIEYRVSNETGQVYKGVFKNGYKGLHSSEKFLQSIDKIQNLINTGWSIEAEVLLNSLEFLYSDDYRMAIFNAATILEFVVVHFWEKQQVKLNSSSRQEKEMVAKLNRKIRQSNYPTKLEKIIRIVLPEFVDQELINSGNLERCIDAWNIRNERLAHLYVQVREGQQLEIRRTKAWSAVASIIDLIDNIEKLSP